MLLADQIVLEFRFHDALKKEYLVQAVNQAIRKNLGRTGCVEVDEMTGMMRVKLWVEVVDCIVGVGGEDADMRDPVPLYERGEEPPPYVGFGWARMGRALA